MISHPLPLQQLCDIAKRAAKEAGEFIEGTDRSKLQRQFKDAGDSAASQVVTEVDLQSEAIIREHLEPTLTEFDIAFVGEESSQLRTSGITERLQRPYHWSVDPLDGTLPFVEGRPGYAVSIALVANDGAPLIGVVYDPENSSVIHAIKGQGSYQDGAPFVRSSATDSSLVVFADRSLETDERSPAVLKAFDGCAHELDLEGVDLVFGNGAVKNAIHVLQRPDACYLKLPKRADGGGSIWDFAATTLIANECGGWSSSVRGKPLDLNRRVSTFMNHEGVLYASNERIARYLLDRLATVASEDL